MEVGGACATRGDSEYSCQKYQQISRIGMHRNNIGKVIANIWGYIGICDYKLKFENIKKH